MINEYWEASTGRINTFNYGGVYGSTCHLLIATERPRAGKLQTAVPTMRLLEPATFPRSGRSKLKVR
jgi:hypothetical protein